MHFFHAVENMKKPPLCDWNQRVRDDVRPVVPPVFRILEKTKVAVAPEIRFRDPMPPYIWTYMVYLCGTTVVRVKSPGLPGVAESGRTVDLRSRWSSVCRLVTRNWSLGSFNVPVAVPGIWSTSWSDLRWRWRCLVCRVIGCDHPKVWPAVCCPVLSALDPDKYSRAAYRLRIPAYVETYLIVEPLTWPKTLPSSPA